MNYYITVQQGGTKANDYLDGKELARYGPFSKTKASASAKSFATTMKSGYHVVLIETGRKTTKNGAKKKKTNKTKRTSARKTTIRRNPLRTYKGHVISGSAKKGFKVQAYGLSFPSLKQAKAWLDGHVRGTTVRANSGRRR